MVGAATSVAHVVGAGIAVTAWGVGTGITGAGVAGAVAVGAGVASTYGRVSGGTL